MIIAAGDDDVICKVDEPHNRNRKITLSKQQYPCQTHYLITTPTTKKKQKKKGTEVNFRLFLF